MTPVTIPYARIKRFHLEKGRDLGGRYVVEELLGEGWEGEVYRVRERQTRIRRAAKLFYPERNRGNRTAARYARKLEKLRHCPIVAQYHHSEILEVRGVSVTGLVSELVEGESVAEFVGRQPGKRMEPYEALHLLHALVVGLECIHEAGEYHGDTGPLRASPMTDHAEFDRRLTRVFEGQWWRPDRWTEFRFGPS